MILQNSIEKIKSEFSHHVLEESEFAGDTSLHINGEKVLDILKLLKNEGFNFLSDLTAVDNLDIGRHERFAVVYHLLSHESAERLTLKAYIQKIILNYNQLNLFGKRQTGRREKYLIFMVLSLKVIPI